MTGAYARNQHPGYTGSFVVGFASMPSLPNLISQFLINQQGFYVQTGHHGLLLNSRVGYSSGQIQAKQQETMGKLSENEQEEAVKGILKAEAEIKFRATAVPTAVVKFYRERPLWRIAAVTLLVLAPIIGYSFVGLSGILFGFAVGIVADIIAPLGRILVIERRR